MLVLTFPKEVIIPNKRVNVLYYIIMGAVSIFVATQFYANKDWLSASSIAPLIKFDTWVERNPLDEVNATYNHFLSEELCTHPENYAYWYDAGGFWTYEGHECIPMCDMNHTGDCLEKVQTYFRETDRQVLVLTELQSWEISPSSPKRKSRSYFLPTAQDMVVAFTYNFKKASRSWYESIIPSSKGASVTADGDDYGSMANILTVLMKSGSDEAYEEIYPTGSAIRISVEKLFMLAGATEWLNAVHPINGRNFKEGAPYPEGPLGYLTGVLLELNVVCSQEPQISPIGQPDWNSPTCYLSVGMVETWNSKEEVSLSWGPKLELLGHGVRIRLVPSGSWYEFDVHQLFLNLASAIVFMRLPKPIMIGIVVYCLGHLSKMYRGILYDRFDLGASVGGMTARLLATSCAFAEVEDRKGEGITFQRLHAGVTDLFREHLVSPSRSLRKSDSGSSQGLQDAVTAALSHSLSLDRGSTKIALDHDEVLAFCRFAFEALRNPNITKSQEGHLAAMAVEHVKSRIRSGSSQSIGDAIEPCPTVSSDMFMEAVSSIENLSFETLIQLFDADRKMSFLEGFFMPRYILKIINREAARKQDLPFCYQIQGDAAKRLEGLTHTKDHVDALYDKFASLEMTIQGDIKNAEILDNTLKTEISRVEADILELKDLMGAAHEFQNRLQSSAESAREAASSPRKQPPSEESMSVKEALTGVQEMRNQVQAYGRSLKDVAEAQWRLSLRLEEHILLTKGERAPVAKTEEGGSPSRSGKSLTTARRDAVKEASASGGLSAKAPQGGDGVSTRTSTEGQET